MTRNLFLFGIIKLFILCVASIQCVEGEGGCSDRTARGGL
jgi:hypothetical protein